MLTVHTAVSPVKQRGGTSRQGGAAGALRALQGVPAEPPTEPSARMSCFPHPLPLRRQACGGGTPHSRGLSPGACNTSSRAFASAASLPARPTSPHPPPRPARLLAGKVQAPRKGPQLESVRKRPEARERALKVTVTNTCAHSHTLTTGNSTCPRSRTGESHLSPDTEWLLRRTGPRVGNDLLPRSPVQIPTR